MATDLPKGKLLELRRPIPHEAPPSPPTHPRRRWLLKLSSYLVPCLAAAAGLGYWIWCQGAEERAVAALPAAERRVLFARTLENLKACHTRLDQAAFRDFCEEQAALARSFPDCRDECVRLSRLPWFGARH